ncbi:MAG: hypothetical protein H0X73_00650 [Chthoniobacterales bacterium]|nr:hypothetical protein [Chthoniobacterales bacterium]
MMIVGQRFINDEQVQFLRVRDLELLGLIGFPSLLVRRSTVAAVSPALKFAGETISAFTEPVDPEWSCCA